MTDKLSEVFGEEFEEQMQEQTDSDDDVQIRLESVLNCVNKAHVDVEHILANMDADDSPDEFESLERIYETLGEMETILQQEGFQELASRDYELPDSMQMEADSE